MKKSSFITLGAALALVAMAAPVSAQVFYFGQDLQWAANGLSPLSSAASASFQSALSGDQGTEDFDGLIAGTTPPIPLLFPGAGTATLTGNGLVDNEDNIPVDGRRAFSGSNYYEIFTDDDDLDTFNILFSDDIVAFGFFGIDVGDYGAQLTLNFYDEFDNLVFAPWSPAHGLGAPGGGAAQLANEGNLNFFGVINGSPFRRVEFTSSGGGVDIWGFDDMTIAVQEQVINPVPEPATMTLLATGLAGMAAARRRKNKKA